MRMSRVLVVGAVLLALIAGAGGTAVASSSPSVTFNFAHNRITAGRSPGVVYSSVGLPRGAIVVLQRWSRTAGDWRQVSWMPHLSGRTLAPAVSMGTYRYRVGAKRAGHWLAVSHSRRLWAYGSVRLATLCASPEVSLGAGSECRAGLGTAQVGSRLFAYQAALHASETSATAFDVASSTCRALHFEIALDPAQDPDGTRTAAIRLYNSGPDLNVGDSDVIPGFLAGSSAVTSLYWPLLPAVSWSLVTEVLNQSPGDYRVLLAGMASCWSPSGA